jgi:hypothetical protein
MDVNKRIVKLIFWLAICLISNCALEQIFPEWDFKVEQTHPGRNGK